MGCVESKALKIFSGNNYYKFKALNIFSGNNYYNFILIITIYSVFRILAGLVNAAFAE